MSKVKIEFDMEKHKEGYEIVRPGAYVLLQRQDQEPDLYIYDYDNKMKLATCILNSFTIQEDYIHVNDIIHDQLKREIKVLGVCDISIRVDKVKRYR